MATTKKCESESIVDEIIADRKNSNLILVLEDMLVSPIENVLLAMEAVKRLFVHFLEKREMYTNRDKEENEQTPEDKYKQWLKERYEDFQGHLMTYVKYHSEKIQRTALDVLMAFIQAEGKYPTKQMPESVWFFPKATFQAVIECLAARNKDMSPLITHFQLYLKDDIKLYALKSLHEILCKDGKKEMQLLANMFLLLMKIKFPKVDDPDVSLNVFIDKEDQKFILKKKSFSKAFTQVWIEFVKCKIPKSVYKRLLVYLPQKVMPHLNDPLLLTDFLTDSYNKGGVTSVLALNGIFYLIQNYNLEYPDFYKRLYSLFTYEVVTSKYRARFFYLADIFLSSTHLTAYLVASFVKRLARLALCVTPDIVLVILPFIANLMIRHRSLQVLIHRPEHAAVLQDPYIFEEQDPVKTKALESSLWEIKTLQKHWHPDVSRKAQFINSELPRMEYDLSKVIKLTMEDMMNKEIATKAVKIPMSYHKPSGLFEWEEDAMNDLWTL